MNDMSIYQITISTMLMGWIVAIVLIWVRYDRFSHGSLILTAVLLWPFLLFDEWLKLSGYYQYLNFLIGAFQFLPAIIAATLVLSIRKLTVEKFANNHILFFLPAVVLAAGQWPLMALAANTKESLLMLPPTGDFMANWPYLATYLFSAFVVLSYAVHSAEYMSSYHYYLSDQVVDVDIYQQKTVSSGCNILIFAAILNIIIVGLVAFDLQPFEQWQQIFNIINAASLLILMLLLMQRDRYSPTPFTDQEFDRKKYSEDQLRFALKQAEQAIIKHKAYKRRGLRIRQISDAANVQPAALALATRFVLKRNFRAFVYHYRLEYAKKVLMRTDQKVTSVARRLGFDSEKYLSNMFVRYIHMMNKKNIDKDQSDVSETVDS